MNEEMEDFWLTEYEKAPARIYCYLGYVEEILPRSCIP